MKSLPPIPIQQPPLNVQCPHCGGQIQFLPQFAGQVVACPTCNGHLQMPNATAGHHPHFASNSRGGNLIQPTPNSLDPSLSILFSILLPGITQLVLGQTVKGLVLLFGTIIIAITTVCIGYLILAPLAAVDGYKLAQKLKNGQAIGEWEWF